MTLKLIKKGLTESMGQCPNCDSNIFIFKDSVGNIKKLNWSTMLRIQRQEIICDNCDSRLKAE